MVRSESISGVTARLRDVDGLRGIAVLAVVVHHFCEHAPWAAMLGPERAVGFLAYTAAPYTVFSNGVDLFFVLSGFCLAYPLLARREDRGSATLDVPGFFARRIIRIYPPYLLAVIALACFAITYHSRIDPPMPVMRGDGSPENVIAHLFFFDRGIAWLNGSFWSLAVEARWYLVFPFAIALYAWSPRLVAILCFASVIAYNETDLQTHDVGCIGLFLAGVIAAGLRVRGIRTPRVAVAFVIFGFTFGEIAKYHYAGGFFQANPFWQMGCVGIVFAANSFERLRAILSQRALVAVGTASYSIYLVHEPIIALIERYLPDRIGLAASLVLAPTVALLAGASLWWLAERPFQHTTVARRAVAVLDAALRRLFERLGCPTTVQLAHQGAGAVVLPRGFTVERVSSSVVVPGSSQDVLG